MPELPEVETIRRGLLKHCKNKVILKSIVRNKQLRWPVTSNLNQLLKNQCVINIVRRSKYLLFELTSGCLLMHFGMSGVVRVVSADTLLTAHDHVDIIFNKNLILRYNDPRRFGAILYIDSDVFQHKLLRELGPEPLSELFSGDYVFEGTRTLNRPIKNWLMDAKKVVGVGNIYANESLFMAKVHPLQPVKSLTLKQCKALVDSVKCVLQKAIEQGGTTLKDFKNAEGKPGYFKQQLLVYGRGGHPCLRCQKKLQTIKMQARQTVFCPNCQS